MIRIFCMNTQETQTIIVWGKTCQDIQTVIQLCIKVDSLKYETTINSYI